MPGGSIWKPQNLIPAASEVTTMKGIFFNKNYFLVLGDNILKRECKEYINVFAWGLVLFRRMGKQQWKVYIFSLQLISQHLDYVRCIHFSIISSSIRFLDSVLTAIIIENYSAKLPTSERHVAGSWVMGTCQRVVRFYKRQWVKHVQMRSSFEESGFAGCYVGSFGG